MRQETLDRRVKYTKTQLENALITLLKEQHISKISVKSLCELADVNRSTFYAHFRDQYDLLQQMIFDVYENINHYLKEIGSDDNMPISKKNLKMILEYGKRNSELFLVLLSENCANLFQKDLDKLLHINTPYFNAFTNVRTQAYLKGFMLSGCVSLLESWLREGMPESAQEMSELIVELVTHGLSSFTN